MVELQFLFFTCSHIVEVLYSNNNAHILFNKYSVKPIVYIVFVVYLVLGIMLWYLYGPLLYIDLLLVNSLC